MTFAEGRKRVLRSRKFERWGSLLMKTCPETFGSLVVIASYRADLDWKQGLAYGLVFWFVEWMWSEVENL